MKHTKSIAKVNKEFRLNCMCFITCNGPLYIIFMIICPWQYRKDHSNFSILNYRSWYQQTDPFRLREASGQLLCSSPWPSKTNECGMSGAVLHSMHGSQRVPLRHHCQGYSCRQIYLPHHQYLEGGRPGVSLRKGLWMEGVQLVLSRLFCFNIFVFPISFSNCF